MKNYFKENVTVALDAYDDDTWNIFRKNARGLLKICISAPSKPKTLAMARMFVFMVGKGYSATYYSLHPWAGGRTDKLAKALVNAIERNLTPIETLIEMTRVCKIRGKEHWSFASKICHILWPDSCPVWDTNAKRTLLLFCKYLNTNKLGFPGSDKALRELTWEEYTNICKEIREKLGAKDRRIRNLHELDKVLWWYGKSQKNAHRFVTSFSKFS